MIRTLFLIAITASLLSSCSSTRGRHHDDPIFHTATPKFSWSEVASLHFGCYVPQSDLDTFAFYLPITFRLSEPGRVIVELECQDSSRIGVLFDSTLSTEGWHAIKWYGDDRAGQSGPVGTFACRIVLPDSVYTDDLTRQTYPNPFSAGSVINFVLHDTAAVSIVVFDVKGVAVRHLLDSTSYSPGRFGVYWDGLDDSSHALSSGVYFYRLYSADSVLATKKTVLVR